MTNENANRTNEESLGCGFMLWGLVPAFTAPLFLFVPPIYVMIALVSQYWWSWRLLEQSELTQTGRAWCRIPVTALGLVVNALIVSVGCSVISPF